MMFLKEISKSASMYFWGAILTLISASACSPAQPPPPGGMGTPLPPVNVGPSVSIAVSSIRILNLPYDALDLNGVQQLQFFVFASDGQHVGSMLDYFARGYQTVHAGDAVVLPASGIDFFTNAAQNFVYVWFLAVDSDATDTMIQTGNNFVNDQLMSNFTQQVAASGTELLTKSNIYAWIAEKAAGVFLSAWQQEDVIGQAAILLSRNNNWNQGRYEVLSPDGNVRLNYSIILNSDHNNDNGGGNYASAPSGEPENTSSTTIADCSGAPQQIFNVGDTVVVDFNQGGALRILTTYEGGAMQTVAQAYDNNHLDLQGGPVCYGGKRYWKVYHHASGKYGWAADGEGSDRWMCPLNNSECGS